MRSHVCTCKTYENRIFSRQEINCYIHNANNLLFNVYDFCVSSDSNKHPWKSICTNIFLNVRKQLCPELWSTEKFYLKLTLFKYYTRYKCNIIGNKWKKKNGKKCACVNLLYNVYTDWKQQICLNLEKYFALKF